MCVCVWRTKRTKLHGIKFNTEVVSELRGGSRIEEIPETAELRTSVQQVSCIDPTALHVTQARFISFGQRSRIVILFPLIGLASSRFVTVIICFVFPLAFFFSVI